MTHLCIAYEVLSSIPQLKKPCDFLLGALAPDSVHFRNNYESAATACFKNLLPSVVSFVENVPST